MKNYHNIQKGFIDQNRTEVNISRRVCKFYNIHKEKLKDTLNIIRRKRKW